MSWPRWLWLTNLRLDNLEPDDHVEKGFATLITYA